MGESFDKIVAGVGKFQREVFPQKAELFRSLGNQQHPKVLFLTCSDSRINPNLITSADPGELFICRNIGNVVPPHGTTDGSVATVMEYAIDVLKIEEIIICGHSGCGAMKSLMDPDDDHIVPRVTEWLRFAASARRLADVTQDGTANWNTPAYLEAVTKLNVITQIANLKTYPAVASQMLLGKLRVHGWYYEIPTGVIQTHDGATGKDFVPLLP